MPWNISAGSIIGPYHIQNKLPNQDDFRINNFAHDGFVLVVADGAGSLKESDKGAMIIVETVMKHVQENFENTSETLGELLNNAFLKARENLLNQENFKELGCTAAGFVNFENNWASIVVGDSFIVTGFENNFKFSTGIQNSDNEFANVTRLMTSDKYEAFVQEGSNNIDFVAVCTDGMMDIGIQGLDSPVVGFWSTLREYIHDENFHMSELLKFLEKEERLVDDTTIAAASLVY